MILNDFTQPKLKFSREKLDTVLADLCGMVIEGQQDNPDFYGMVAAAVIDPKGRLVTGVNYLYGNSRVHAERAAIDRYEEEYGQLPKGCIVVTTLSPCSEDTHDNRQGASCTAMLNKKRIKLAYCGYQDPTQEKGDNDFTVIITDNGKIKELCKSFADTFLKHGLRESTELNKAKQFIDNVYSQYPDWPYGQADKVMVWGDGEDQQFAAFKLKPGISPDTVEIDWIMAGPEQRQGVGSRAIKELQRQAQAAGIKLTLYPWAKGNVSQASLTKLYKRHGFKPVAKGAKPMSWEPQLDELKIDNVKGLGAVPYNQEVDYMGLKVKMKPSVFLQLSLPLSMNDDDKKTIQHLEREIDTRGFGAPFLEVNMDREFPRIIGHDGRHRMMAIKDVEGDNPVEVHMFPRGMRNKDITPEVVSKLNDLVVSQNGKYVPGPIFTTTVSENFADGRVKGKSRPGRVKKAGASCKGSVTDLRSKAKNSSGERAKMYHWCANMKSGKKKTNEESSKQILSYIKKIHPKGEFSIDHSVMNHAEWELTRVPLSSLHIESDEVSPYDQINWIDYDHVADITAQDIKAKPIVIDREGWIIDGNHRAVAARDMGMTHIPAYVPVESDDDEETYDQHMTRVKRERELAEDKSFNQCYAQACKLYDQAEAKGLEPRLVQVAGYKGDGSQAHSKWLEIPQTHWQHYVTIVGNTVLDPTAKQFGPDKEEKYSRNQLDSEWDKQYQIKPKKLSEVIHHPGIKTKTADVSGLVNRGEPVPPGKERRLLGTKVGKLGAYEVYKWDKGNDSAYSVFDPETRISQMTISGHNKPHHFEIFGIYGGPKAPIRAADLYAWLVKNQGLTLVSDKYQSPGGQRVWQELEQRYGRSVNVYAFNMRTNQPINTGADDPESTHGHRGDIAQNVRLVAAPK
jgi:pyrimidine deaminase RibD-like protein/GNAT superfamily N-acetyltransferase